jgi:hypothetical protein
MELFVSSNNLAIGLVFLLPSPPSTPLITMTSTILFAGKAEASRRSLTRFSQTTKHSALNKSEHKLYFVATTKSSDKAALRLLPNFAVVFAGVDENGMIFPVTLPHLTLVDGAIIGISVLDNMERISPATISSYQFEQSVITCVTQLDVERFNLPSLMVNAVDPANIPSTHPAGSTVDPPASLARLGWIDTNPDPKLIPVFAATPKILPVQAGSTMPWEHDVRTPIPVASANVSQLGRMHQRSGLFKFCI